MTHEEAYLEFEEKEARLLDHWLAPIVATKAFKAGWDAALASHAPSTPAVICVVDEWGPREANASPAPSAPAAQPLRQVWTLESYQPQAAAPVTQALKSMGFDIPAGATITGIELSVSPEPPA